MIFRSSLSSEGGGGVTVLTVFNSCSYLLEQSLSVDNLFVFVLVFKYFKVPLMYQVPNLYMPKDLSLDYRVISFFGLSIEPGAYIWCSWCDCLSLHAHITRNSYSSGVSYVWIKMFVSEFSCLFILSFCIV